MNESKLRKLINIFTTVATVVLFALMLGLIFQFTNQAILRARYDELQAELSTITYEIEYYEDQNNPTYLDMHLEQYAREYYNYGKYGEHKYTYD